MSLACIKGLSLAATDGEGALEKLEYEDSLPPKISIFYEISYFISNLMSVYYFR